MRFCGRNLLLSILVIQLAVLFLSTERVSAGFFDFNKNKKNPTPEEDKKVTTDAGATAGVSKGGEPNGANKAAAAKGGASKAGTVLVRPVARERGVGDERVTEASSVSLDQGQTNRQLERMDSDQSWETASQRSSFDSKSSPITNGKNQKRFGQIGGADHIGMARRFFHSGHSTAGSDDEQSGDDDNDAYDDEDDDSQGYFGGDDEDFDIDSYNNIGGSSNGRGKGGDDSESIRKELTDRYVSTLPKKGDKSVTDLLPPINFKQVKLPNGKSHKSGPKNKLMSGKYWSKQLGKVYKKTKEGTKEIPKLFEQAGESMMNFAQLDGKSKIQALINDVKNQAQFVRKEFSQFTFTWSQLMERALDFLGDTDLDQVEWNQNDELDLRGDALHSLAFGYEFMLIMIVWRENLLVAHEAFMGYLQMIKIEVEAKRISVDGDLIMQLGTTHAYMQQLSWNLIQDAYKEPREKIRHMEEIHDAKQKNYESVFFRDFIVYQEMYAPTMEELDEQLENVKNTIRDSCAVADNLGDNIEDSIREYVAKNLESAHNFFMQFRNLLATNKLTNVDWEVPAKLSNLMTKLRPQLRKSPLVYTRGFLDQLGLI